MTSVSRGRSGGGSPVLSAMVLPVSIIVFAALAVTGCGPRAPASKNYFALAEGNSWLMEGAETAGGIKVEINAVKPDASLNLGQNILDLNFSGSMGQFATSEQGLFLEVTPVDAKLWGVRAQGEPPRFFNSPYIWLKQPLAVGQELNTALQGASVPPVMTVTQEAEVDTPWGRKKGFVLEEKKGGDPAGRVRATFVPYLGFAKLQVPGWPELVLTDAALK